MAILHYTIGLPPTRNGGSIQYAYDLAKEQSNTEKVMVLICGDTLFHRGKTKIKYIEERDGVQIFALNNPLTPTLIYGVSDPENQHREIDIDYENIRNFIVSNQINVMHLHTLMGIHSRVVEFIKSLGVKIVYTSHDFHGICLHYNLIDPHGNLCDRIDVEKCAQCNLHEPSDRFLRIANSSLYHSLKGTGIFNILKKPKVKIQKSANTHRIQDRINDNKIKEYSKLIEYYKDYFNLIDKFHFNSSQTKIVFKKFLPAIEGKVIPVITSGIKDRRKPLSLSKEIKFGFIGSLNEYKGFPVLKKILTELYAEGHTNFKLMVYSGNNSGVDLKCPNIIYKPPYDYTQISEILNGLDSVIIPSKWYETFSLVALESLAHGRPVIISDHVGAKDIVEQFAPDMIFSTPKMLKSKLKDILENPQILVNGNAHICSGKWDFTLEYHVKEIISYYYS